MEVETDPSKENLLDALSLVAAWREAVDDAEQDLIDAARLAEATWEQIGLAQGYRLKGAKQGASQRRKRLGEAKRVL